ncbi:MAG: hypothetical protein ACI8QF_003896 [Limisphaerales bacterium]|jgi:hypothetical protein
MDTFYNVFGFVAAICAGIVILALFFTALGLFNRKTRGFSLVRWKGFIKEGRLVNVVMKDGKSSQGLRFLGFTDQGASTQGIPYQLAGMVVLEKATGARIFIRADSVKLIEEVDEGDPAEHQK